MVKKLPECKYWQCLIKEMSHEGGKRMWDGLSDELKNHFSGDEESLKRHKRASIEALHKTSRLLGLVKSFPKKDIGHSIHVDLSVSVKVSENDSSFQTGHSIVNMRNEKGEELSVFLPLKSDLTHKM